jgi:hypothetical protein
MTPNLPVPVADDGCGGLGQIIMIVVAVVATVFTAGALAAGFGPLGSMFSAGLNALGAGISGLGIAGAAGGATLGVTGFAVAGAVGSIVSQGVGIAIGAQDKFSWSAVGSGALGAVISGGAGTALKGMGLLAQGAQGAPLTTAQIMQNAALTSVASQGVMVTVGLQDKFSWAGVAAAAISAPIANAVGSGVESATGSKFLADFASRFAGGVVSRGVSIAVHGGGKMGFATIAADAFGNALGSSIVDRMSGGNQQESELTKFKKSEIAAMNVDARIENAIAMSPATWSDFSGSGARTFADQYPETYGGQLFSIGANNDSATRTDEMARIMRQANEPQYAPTDLRIEVNGIGSTDPELYNGDIIAAAIAHGENLRPTIANAERLGLVDLSVTEAGGEHNGYNVAPTGQMPYAEQMRNAGNFVSDLGAGFISGIPNAITETAGMVYKGWGYIGAQTVIRPLEAMGLQYPGATDRAMSFYDGINGRVLQYENGIQEFGGVVGGLVSPTSALRRLAVAGDVARARLATAIRTEYELGWGSFATSGVDLTSNPALMNSNVAKALQSELIAGGKTLDFALRKAEEIINSGVDLPTMRNASTGEFFYKLQPTDVSGNPLNSVYWMNSSQYARVQAMNVSEIANAMGLPAPSAAHGGFNGFAIFETTPRLGSNAFVFESQIAPATQGARYATKGLDYQSLIVNPTAWHPARPIGIIPPVGR